MSSINSYMANQVRTAYSKAKENGTVQASVGSSFAASLANSVSNLSDILAENTTGVTQEQIDDLKSRYDVANLKLFSDEARALGQELYALGLIDEIQMRYLTDGALMIPSGPLMMASEVVSAASSSKSLNLNLFNFDVDGDGSDRSIMGSLSNIFDVVDNHLSLLRDSNAVYSLPNGLSTGDCIKSMEEFSKRYSDLFDVLKLLK